ncbi:nitroreductase family deazaflavin-dependent oxidoreductase [Nonomuraea sp. NPDC004354]
MPEQPTADQWPDIARPDAGTVLVTESPAQHRATVEQAVAGLERGPWPEGLLSFSAFASTDGEKVLTYTQWADGGADREFTAGATGAEPVEYRLYRAVPKNGVPSPPQDGPPSPGILVAAGVGFDGPDPERQRRWVDTVLAALDGETAPAPGGISGYFHVSTDGTRALAYAEWTDEQAHRDAVEGSGQGTVGSSPGWRLVREFPGVTSGGFTRYRLLRSLSTPAPGTRDETGTRDEVRAQDEVVDNPTGWVAAHIQAYVESDGARGHLYQGWPTLLLTTRGRRSGKRRRTALIYGQDGDRYLLVASNAGSAQHPAWYLNLIADPEVDVQVAAEKFTARARLATAEEKGPLWERMAEIFPLYDSYQEKSARDIPLVILERLDGKKS